MSAFVQHSFRSSGRLFFTLLLIKHALELLSGTAHILISIMQHPEYALKYSVASKGRETTRLWYSRCLFVCVQEVRTDKKLVMDWRTAFLGCLRTSILSLFSFNNKAQTRQSLFLCGVCICENVHQSLTCRLRFKGGTKV